MLIGFYKCSWYEIRVVPQLYYLLEGQQKVISQSSEEQLIEIMSTGAKTVPRTLDNINNTEKTPVFGV